MNNLSIMELITMKFIRSHKKNLLSKSVIKPFSLRRLDLVRSPLLFILLFSFLFSGFLYSTPLTQIFVLHSYSQEYPWTQGQHIGFIQTINKYVNVNASYSIEYLDTKRHSYDDIYADEMEHYLQIKYKGFNPTAIYVTDDNALLFTCDHLSHIFPGVPVFFSGINNYEVWKSLDSTLYTGVFELKDVTTNIELVLSLDKNANDLIFIGDGSNTYKAIESAAIKELNAFHLRTKFIVEKRLDIVLKQLQNLPGKYVFLTTIGGMTDAKGDVLSLRDIMKSLVNTGRIIISMEDGYIKEGVLGGYVTSSQNQGSSAAHLLLAYLNGKKINNITPVYKSPNAWIFDDNVIKQYKIKLPENIASQTIFLNPRLSIYEKYKYLVIGSLVGFALLLFLVVTGSLVIMWRKNKELRNARNILQESEQSYRNQFKKNSTIMLLIDPVDGKIIDANDAAIKFYGYSHNVLLSMSIFDINILPSSETQKYMATVSQEEGKHFVFQHRLADGTIKDVEVSASKILLSVNSVLHAIIYDVTEKKKSEEKLANYTLQIELKNKELDLALANERMATAKANEMVEKTETANKAKSMFLTSMSHEIRTPLNAIIGFSQILEKDSQLAESQKEYVSLIIRSGDALLQLINNILELSKLDSGRVSLTPANIDLYSFLNEIKIKFKDQVQLKHLQFNLEIAKDVPKYIVVDDVKLQQIFINIIGNAIKFTDNGSITLRANVNIIDKNDIKLIVDIQDSGSGIPESEFNDLFKHFVQTSTGISQGTGTGLGLALSKELAILMGGDISVKSEVGKGSIFTIEIAIKVENNSVQEKIDNENIIGINEGQQTYRILVVDDKIENLKIVSKLLHMIGFETIEAYNGKDAILKFEERNPDLILMDVRMPVMDGYEATRIIRSTEKGKFIPIIALTANSMEDENEDIASLNMQGHIRKPFRKNELYTIIGKALNINYIYEEKVSSVQNINITDNKTLIKGIIDLPNQLKLQMLNSIAVADMDMLVNHIKSIASSNLQLSQYLMSFANNYDYENLQNIITNK